MEKENRVEVKIPEFSTSAAETAKIVATLILVIGVIGCIFMFIKGIDDNPILIVISIVSIIYVVAIWALLCVIANISLQLKAIQESMPLRLIDKSASEINSKEQLIQGEVAVSSETNTGIKVGDKVTWKKTMTKYTIEAIRDNEVYLFTGMFGGYKWIPEDELIIPHK